MNYRGLTLDGFQKQAVEEIENGHSVIVSAPTGTGKTLIADYLIERILDEGGEVIYTSPIKALSNQKYRQYVELFGEEAVGLVTGDIVIRRDAPLRIMTTEILRNILLEGHHDANLVEEGAAEEEDVVATSPAEAEIPDLRHLKAVIVDEIHFLDDPDRGTVWEELLIYLPHEIRILGLSATLSNLHDFADWLSKVRHTQVKVIHEPKRTVPLKFFMMSNETGLLPVDKFNKRFAQWRGQRGRSRSRQGGRGRGGRGSKRDSTRHIEVVEALHGGSFPALYFIFSRALVERLAGDLSRSNVGKSVGDRELSQKIGKKLDQFEREHPGVLTRKLSSMYTRGIAFHHAGLHVSLKSLVEELYEAGLIRVLYCTSTFALGINMPARTVIFDGLTKYDGNAINPLTVREFMQMAGRAGRRGIDTEGDIIIRQDFHDYERVQPLIKRLLGGESEPVDSSFNLSFHAVVNLLARFEEENIRALLEQSFKAWRSRQIATDLEGEIARREDLLEGDVSKEEEELSSKQLARKRRHRRRLTSLKRRLVEEQRPRLWEEFNRKLEFLRAHGYIGRDNELFTAARILQQIKMEEIFLTELLMSGALEGLSPEQLYGVMCGLVQTLPRTAKIAHGGAAWSEVHAAIYPIYQSDIVQGAAQLTDSEVVCTPEVMQLGERWAKGESLAQLMKEIDNPTDLSGDIVGALRRAKDLISQIRAVYSDDKERRRALSDLMRRVSRDEVEVVS